MTDYPITIIPDPPTPEQLKHLWQNTALRALAKAIAASICHDRAARRTELPADEYRAIIPIPVAELEEVS